MTTPAPQCLVCQETNETLPLLALNYRGQQYWICPQHLPMLIHQPEKLVGLLPGAERLQAQEHDD